MKAKKLSFLLMLIFVLLLSACSGGKETTGNAKDPEKEDPPVKEEEPAEEEVTYDLGGRVIKIVNHWDMTPQGGTELGDLAVQKVKDVEEKYNVKIEYHVVPWEEKVNQLTASVLANEPIGDLVGLDTNMTAAMVQQDYLYALDDIIDISNSKINDTLKKMGTFNEKVYLMKHETNESGGMYYNKTMFEQAGLTDPYELQEAGEWTWDAMLDAAKKLTTGSNYGLSGDANLLAEYSIVTNGGKVLDTTTGEVLLDSPEAMEGLEFMASLFNEHKVVKPNEGDTWNNPRQYFTEGLVGMTQGWVWEADGRSETPFEWGYVFWPKGPKGSDYQTIVSSAEGMTIPKGVESPEIVYQIWEDLQLWEANGENVIEWFEDVMPNEESVDTATQMLEKINANYWPAYDLYDAFWGTYGSISNGDESPSQAIAKVKGEAQARVDKFMGKE
ncbi:ABC transporter substrate-binding protein [Lederbergia wuyishanensis]|uniref:ABC-type glycerol-3-phosphate transport system substrate-binding protein n=1 Tax=Lederbergia wuyishanensis TaxID=1347903 RepID=A0ABU0DA18_9BACI|nr:extracellular solute-binding protein [Lederbergia wuyishanensis]MCJ8009922.1 extracellular solute-binding protein [Lederbergia wuyishanensis]MDQ0345269.1 ABC-type glycerol-3-phosphate transport system substrate-binding protein [Lederbergia wuyishanensis]